MSIEKTVSTRHHQRGVTIVELMISIVLGLLLMLAATAMTASSMIMNADTLKSAKLNQDVDSVIQVMVNDIRRAGYGHLGGASIFTTYGDDLGIVSSDCILYAYDANENGTLDTTERYGFKLVGSEINIRTGCTTGACATSCAAGTWVPITDDQYVTISKLKFDSEHSKCLSLTGNDNRTIPGNNNNFWVTNTDSAINFPCSPLVLTSNSSIVSKLTTYALDVNGVYQSTGTTFVDPAGGDRLIEARQVNVEIEGAVTNDANMKKVQNVAINVRNNHVRTVP